MVIVACCYAGCNNRGRGSSLGIEDVLDWNNRWIRIGIIFGSFLVIAIILALFRVGDRVEGFLEEFFPNRVRGYDEEKQKKEVK